MSNRKGADLGLTLVNLGYVLPTPASIGACKSTVGPGLPLFIGRGQGDLHRNLTDSKEYVLTGTAGASYSDDFNRANGALGNTSVGNKAWSNGGSAPQPAVLVSNKMAQGGNANVGAFFQASITGRRTVSADFVLGVANSVQLVAASLDNYSGAANYVTFQVSPGLTTATLRKYVANSAVVNDSFTLGSALAAGSAHTLAVVIDPAAGKISAYIDGNLVGTSTDPTPTTTDGWTYVGAMLVDGTGFSATADNFAVTADGTLAWAPAAGGSMTFRGAWVSGAYAVNDVVSDAYGLWVALAAVPSGAAYEPALAPTYTPATQLSAVGDPATSTGGPLGADHFYQAFTTDATGMVVNRILLRTGGANPAGTALIGIASAPGASPSAITWVGATPTAVAVPTTAGTFVVTLPAQLTLAPNTTYYVAGVYASGGGAYNVAIDGATIPPSGHIASAAATTGYVLASGSGTAWSTLGGRVPFQLQGSLAPYWQKLANSGNQENVGQVAAAGAALTIPDPEIQPITRAVLTANTVVALPTVVPGKSFTVVLVQDATGGRTVGWGGGATVLWPGGTAPTQTPTAGKGDVYSFMADGSGNWLGFVGGQNY